MEEQEFDNLNISPIASNINVFYRQLNVNLLAAVNVTQCVAKGMIAKGTGGSIVNISSGV